MNQPSDPATGSQACQPGSPCSLALQRNEREEVYTRAYSDICADSAKRV